MLRQDLKSNEQGLIMNANRDWKSVDTSEQPDFANKLLQALSLAGAIAALILWLLVVGS